jgi:hypothetical protein
MIPGRCGRECGLVLAGGNAVLVQQEGHAGELRLSSVSACGSCFPREGEKMSQLTHSVRRGPRWAWLAASALLVPFAAVALLWIGRASADTSTRTPNGRQATKDFFAVSNVPTPKADAAVSTFYASCTCSPRMHEMDGMSKTFSLGGRISRPVIVMFQGEFFANDLNAAAFVRLVIDGRAQNDGEEVVVFGYRVQETHGFNWVSEPLAPGTHTAVIEWRDTGTAPAYVAPRSMIILHK